MKVILNLAMKSLWNRRGTAILTVLSIAVSVALLLSVERIREGAQDSFESTLSGTDLIVGARTGGVQLLLYSVFNLGAATNNIDWKSYEYVASHPEVKWAVPLSLGDSHRGYRVVGTSTEFFDRYRYGREQALEFAEGGLISDVFDAVIGADVASSLEYELGTRVVLSHGIGEHSFLEHDDKPFVIAGILKRTGTAVDRNIYISLAGIEAIHVDWEDGAPPTADKIVPADKVRGMDLTPHEVTAALVGVKSKFGIFRLEREINEFKGEPLLAILPGATFQQLWQVVSTAEKALRLVALFVVLGGLMGMLTAVLTSLNERRREMAILRAVGAKTIHVFWLLVIESGVLVLLGVLLGALSVSLFLVLAASTLQSWFGITVLLTTPTTAEWGILLMIWLAGIFVGAVPAWRAYRRSLADGLTIRI